MMKTDFQHYRTDLNISFFRCLEGPHEIQFAGHVDNIRELISRRIASKRYQEAEYFDIDGYLTPASKEAQAKTKSGEYFVKAQIKSSEKKGDQVVIYAGKKGQKDKSQIFVDPKHGKLTFDQNNINPRDIFTRIEAKFRDGSTVTMDTKNDDEAGS